MANEHSIRVSARGEFGQLQRGLKQLQGDLKGVLGGIDKGARKGGIFDDSSLRALNVYRSRFKSSLDEINREFQKQNDVIDRLHSKMATAQRSEREDIQKNINLREKNLDVLRRQLYETERLYKRRMDEASTYERAEASASRGGGVGSRYAGGGGMGFGSGLGGGMLSRILGVGRFGMGLAGIGGIASMASQAYQGAYTARTLPMDLAQRIRGQGGWKGDSYNMWNRAYGIGTQDRMGYTAQETWEMQDQYSRMAGTLNGAQLGGLLKFGRSYGLSTSEVAQGVGGVRELGGVNDPKHFADMIAKSVSSSGMTPRILEVMQTSAGLLSQMNTSLKDTGAKQILAYQTTLDKLGTENGMMKLTGQNGANIISGLGGIYDPQATDWKYMGMQALQRYDPGKYGKMGLYDLETTFEDGLMNDDNLPAMVKYLREKSGGNENLMKRMLQKWLQAGGYNATKTQVNELYDVTDGFSAFDKDKMQKVQNTLEQGNSEENYQNRVMELGQGILDTNARFEKQLEEIGQPMLELVQNIKEDFTGILEWATENDKIQEILQGISDFLGENWKDLLTGTVMVAIGALLLKGIMGMGGLIFKGMSLLRGGGGGGDIDIFDPPDKKGGKGGKGGDGKGGGKSKKIKAPKWWSKLPGWGKGLIGGASAAIAGAGAYLGINAINENRTEGKWEDYIKEMESQGIKRKDIEKSGIAKGSFWTQDDNYVKWHGDRLAAGKAVPEISKSKQKEVEEYMKENNLKVKQKEDSANIKKLSDKGTDELGLLAAGGTASMASLLGVGDEEFNNLFETGDLNFTELFEAGSDKFTRLYKDGSTFLKGVFNEHSGFKSFFEGLWNNFATTVSGILGGIGVGAGGGGGASGLTGNLAPGSNYSVLNNSGISAQQLNSKLGGKLSGKGQKIINTAQAYGIDPAFMAAVMMHETGNGTNAGIMNKNNVGGMMGKNGQMSFKSVDSSIEYMGDLLNRLYIQDGLTTVEEIQKRWAPVGAKNDPSGLNKNWVGGVYDFMNGFGVTSGGQNHSGAGKGGGRDVFNNWQKKVTSNYGMRGGSMHWGMDIDGDQGDYLGALQAGKVVAIQNDPKNKTPGGNTVKIQMADGKSYSYAHMSKINPALKKGSKVSIGEWIGNMGGEKGKPGSGYSTDGSHLHLSAFMKSGARYDPRLLLNNILGSSRGSDTPAGYNGGASRAGYQMDSTMASLSGMLGTGVGGAAAASAVNVNVTVTLKGDTEKLNGAKQLEIKKLIQEAIKNYEQQKLLMNPVARGRF